MLAAARASQMLHTATAANGYLDPSAARWERLPTASTWRTSVSRSFDMTHPQLCNASVLRIDRRTRRLGRAGPFGPEHGGLRGPEATSPDCLVGFEGCADRPVVVLTPTSAQ